MKRKPTRRDLLVVISRLHNMMSCVVNATNDRNPNRAAQVAGYFREANVLVMEALSHDPPMNGLKGPWSGNGTDCKREYI